MSRWIASVYWTVLTATALMAVAASHEKDFESCESIVLGWRYGCSCDGISTVEAKAKGSNLQKLLFFLHVPRSGGRSFFHCFLRQLFRDLECPVSYGETLSFNPSESSCRLVAAHRGYDMTSKLPKHETSVLTVLRHPLDRVLSSYEKAVEWAARFLLYPNSTSAAQATEEFLKEWRGLTVLDLWPWKYLLPWMIGDLFARREGRGNGIQEIKDPYDIEEIVIPLYAFINHPLAHELIHNGATFQVAGLTNNSYLKESHTVRRCVQEHPSLGHYVLDVAKERLEKMFHVGLIEKHKESARMFAEAVGAQAISELQVLASQLQLAASADDKGAESSSSILYSVFESESNAEQHPALDFFPRHVIFGSENVTPSPNMTVAKLMEAYDKCLSRMREYEADRRSSSLKYVSPVVYSREGRRRIAESTLQQIISLNSLDVQLHRHAQKIFEERQQRHMQKLLSREKENDDDAEEINISISSWPSRNRVLVVPLALMSIACALLLVIARLRALKLKNH